MAYMVGLRCVFTTCFFLSLILAPLPLFSSSTVVENKKESSEVYEIDYRGPETHSSVPPPHRFPRHPKTSLIIHTQKKG
ncbi:hypothetical protein S83_006107 [Arachis hypogaea]